MGGADRSELAELQLYKHSKDHLSTRDILIFYQLVYRIIVSVKCYMATTNNSVLSCSLKWFYGCLPKPNDLPHFLLPA